MPKKVVIYTAEGLAEKLNKSYSRLRAILAKSGKETDIDGFKLIKQGTTWLAFDPKEYELQIEDASREVKEKNKQYRIPKQ